VRYYPYRRNESRGDSVLLIDAPGEVIIDRISGRVTCPRGHVFHISHSPPGNEGVCDHDDEPLSQRDVGGAGETARCRSCAVGSFEVLVSGVR
jgi:hypothetical protein